MRVVTVFVWLITLKIQEVWCSCFLIASVSRRRKIHYLYIDVSLKLELTQLRNGCVKTKQQKKLALNLWNVTLPPGVSYAKSPFEDIHFTLGPELSIDSRKIKSTLLVFASYSIYLMLNKLIFSLKIGPAVTRLA